MRRLVLHLVSLALLFSSVAAQPAPKPRVLYIVESSTKGAGDFRKAIATETTVETQTAAKLTPKAVELARFDTVIIDDVPASALSAAQLTALDAYATDGGALFVAGGEKGFGDGAYAGTRLERMLPVRFDSKPKDSPDLAVMFVVDRTTAMKGKPLAAVTSAIAALEGFAPNDFVGVVTFDSEATVLVRPQRAANKARISADLARMTAGGAGANLFVGIKEAYEILQSVNARAKHVIVVTNSKPDEAGLVDLVHDARAARITMSTVGFPSAKRDLLREIAKIGDGRFHALAIDDAPTLAKIVPKELAAALNAADPGDKVHVRVAKKAPMIDGIAIDTAPALNGYISLRPKPTSEVILISDLGEPLLARWQYGKGVVAVWTSDLDLAWSADLVKWPGYAKFWAQVVTKLRANRPS